MPHVSIIMPTYNRAWIIDRAIQSVLDQTFVDFELIIIDDGSSDDTADVLENYSDKRIIRLSSAHLGQCGARNLGLSRARGKLISYLDSDNRWHPNFLEVMTASMGRNVLIYSGQNLLLSERLSHGERIIGRRTRTRAFNPQAMLKGNLIDTNAAMHTAAVLKEVGNFDVELEHSVDWDLFVRMVIAHPLRVAYVDQILGDYHYYTSASSTTITNTADNGPMMASFGLGERDASDQAILSKIAGYLRASELPKQPAHESISY